MLCHRYARPSNVHGRVCRVGVLERLSERMDARGDSGQGPFAQQARRACKQSDKRTDPHPARLARHDLAGAQGSGAVDSNYLGNASGRPSASISAWKRSPMRT